jgi:hypothetical protein
MALRDLLTGGIDEVTGKAKGSENGSQFTLEEGDWDNTFGDNLVAGQWVDAAEFIVPAQTQYNVGYGVAGNEATVGRFYSHFEDGSGNVTAGQVRIVTRDANDKNVETDISSLSTSRLDADATDYRTQVAVPEVLDTNRVGQDSKVVMQFKLKSGSTGTSIDFPASDQQLDLTEY